MSMQPFMDPERLELTLKNFLLRPVHSVLELQNWIEQYSELCAEIEDEMLLAKLDFKRHTDTTECKERDKYYDSVIRPLLERYTSEFDKCLLESQYIDELDHGTYGRFIKDKRLTVSMFREENLPLEAEERQLISQYYEIISGMKIQWDGDYTSRTAASSYLQSKNSTLRETAWRAIHEAELGIKDSLDTIMTSLVRIRHKIATNSGYANYVDYMFAKLRREYSPNDCKSLHKSIESFVVPVQDEIRAHHHRRIGGTSYRPWDEGEVGHDFPSLWSVDRVIFGVEQILMDVSPQVGKLFQDMQINRRLDIEPRPNKVPGGFNAGSRSSHHSFIFLNLDLNFRAVMGLIHEMGHAFHHSKTVDHTLYFNRKPGFEACELASLSIELFSLDKWSHLFDNPQDVKMLKQWRMQFSIRLIVHAATIDAFQHWIYENPYHTSSERDQAYIEIRKRLSGHYINWDGLEQDMVTDWLGIIHIFNYPFYFIEYAIAEIGAQQLQIKYVHDPQEAFEAYELALKCGNTLSLKDIYAVAGIRFEFTEGMVQHVTDHIRRTLSFSTRQ